MLKNRAVHSMLAVAMVALVIILAGGLAIASNAGFKLNKELIPGTCNIADQVGRNWTSIPYFNPYGDPALQTGWDAFCAQTGLPIGIFTGAQLTVLLSDSNPPAFSSARCGTAGMANLLKVKGRGVEICAESLWPAGTGIIIVGSHDPTFQFTLTKPTGAGLEGRYWYSPPYHTTNSTCAQLCTSAGLTPGIFNGALITRLNATNGIFSNSRCGSAGCNTLALPLGEHIQIAEPNAPKSFVPAHF